MISEEDTDKYLAEVLELLKQKFEGGDKSALLDAIYYWCLMNRSYGFVEATAEEDGKPSDPLAVPAPDLTSSPHEIGSVVGLPQFRPLPEWLRRAFLDAYEARARFEIRSWNEVFGRPVPKNTHFETEKRNAELRFLIIERVEALKAEYPVDKGLFAKIGRELNPPLKGTTVSEIYYDERSRELREMIYGPSGIF
jgi:hypothetical protein